MNKNSLNKAIIIGRLGHNPEARTTQGGMTIANFSLATTDTKKDASGQYQDTTDWHNCVSFGKQAEYINNYFRKGQLVMVEGKLKTSKWQDKQNITHYKTEIVVETATALERSDIRHDNQNPTQTHQQPQNAQQNANPQGSQTDDEELPF